MWRLEDAHDAARQIPLSATSARTLGRSDIRADARRPRVSGNHIELRIVDDALLITQLGRNPTHVRAAADRKWRRVSKDALEPTRLQAGDVISLVTEEGFFVEDFIVRSAVLQENSGPSQKKARPAVKTTEEVEEEAAAAAKAEADAATVLLKEEAAGREASRAYAPASMRTCRWDGACFSRDPAHWLLFAHPRELAKPYCPVRRPRIERQIFTPRLARTFCREPERSIRGARSGCSNTASAGTKGTSSITAAAPTARCPPRCAPTPPTPSSRHRPRRSLPRRPRLRSGS